MGASGNNGWLVLFVMCKMIQGSATGSSYLSVYPIISVYATHNVVHAVAFTHESDHLHVCIFIFFHAFSCKNHAFLAFYVLYAPAPNAHLHA